MIGQVVFHYLPPAESVIVERAQRHGLPGSHPPPAYLAPDLCTVLSLLLAIPSLGYSLLLIPLVWVAQHERTNRRLELLRYQLEQFDEGLPAALGRPVECSSRHPRKIAPQ